jgi:hypothetical protein
MGTGKKRLPCRRRLRIGWALQGDLEKAHELRRACREEGMTATEAWRTAWRQFRLQKATVEVLRGMERKWVQEYRDRKSGKKRAPTAVEQQEAYYRQQAREQGMLVDSVAHHTGVPLIDWIYANMDRDEPLPEPKPQSAIDYRLLKYFQTQPDQFYDLFTEALVRRWMREGRLGRRT